MGSILIVVIGLTLLVAAAISYGVFAAARDGGLGILTGWRDDLRVVLSR